jgi:hypothetical protein
MYKRQRSFLPGDNLLLRHTLKGMDQQEAGKKHDCAGHAMNGEGGCFPTARHKNVGHVAKRNHSEDKEDDAYRPVGRGQHKGQYGQTSDHVSNPFQMKPCKRVHISGRRLETKGTQNPLGSCDVETTDHDDPNRDEDGKRKRKSAVHNGVPFLEDLATLGKTQEG